MKCRPVALCCLAFCLLCGIANAYSVTKELPGREKETLGVELNEGDEVSGRITLIGGAINFSVSDPEGRIIVSYTVSDPADFRFDASKTGAHSFHLENYFSDNTVFITLNYNVQHYIFGFPQEFILLFVIIGCALVGVVMFVALSPKP
ncbi:MAG: emp24/gp25L/p24 family protein [Candidatus Bathyarchaeota archaeon]|nr:MAG: emp24/gp25L/p24 family protein [Candidatus Bathyarchaeota archaeon]